MGAVIDINFRRHAEELRATWQARALLRTFYLHEGFLCPQTLLGACMLSVIAHNYDDDDAVTILLRATFPGFRSIAAPFLCSAAKIARGGQIMADLIMSGGRIMKRQELFKDSRAMETAFRRLADSIDVSDDERIEMFGAVKRWVVCDYRLDPTMNPADPDARRLSH